MADKLTPQQAQAVHNRGGKLLVSAAAGSGKTKVLVDRLMTYLTDVRDPANLDDFLIITYTKAAAAELRGKIAAKLSQRIAGEPENKHLQKQMQRLFLAKISTVHGFCGDILREYAYRLDIPADFRVADENECREIREQVLKDLLDRAYAQAEDPDFRAFVDTQGLGRDDRLVPQIIEKVYDSARCHLNPKQWLDTCLTLLDAENAADASETIWGKYLIDDLHDYLDCQILVIEACANQLSASEGMEKAAINLRDTLYQLQALREENTWDGIVKKRSIDYGRLVFPKKNVDLELAERVKAARKGCKAGLERKLKNFAEDSAQVLADLAQSADGARGLTKLVEQFDRDYRAAKRSRRILDFSDLEHSTLDLLLGKARTSPTAAAAEIGGRYREILVDEYQDSNGVQDAVFSVLSREKQNCFLVGDVKQSIYQFRLADPGIFLEKYETYAPAEGAQPGQGRKVLLSHNFRSGAEVIEAVNHVFSACMTPKVGGLYYTEAEALREGVPHLPLPDPGVELYALETVEDTYGEEAAYVAGRIREMLDAGTPVRDGDTLRPVVPGDIVILLRSPGSAGGYFQRALEAQGIRCSTGGGTDLLQTQEIGTFRSLLQTVMNPRQDIPLISVLASPVFGFSAEDLAQIRGKQKKGSFYEALVSSGLEKAEAFLTTLKTLRAEAKRSTLSGLMEKCLLLTRMDSVFGAMPGGEAKAANIQTFYQYACDFEKGTLRELSQFLEHLDQTEERGLVTAGSAGADCVNIMSIHKSKGLEFPVVFLCNLSRRFNQEDLRAQILCDRTLGLGLSSADIENRIRYPSLAKRAIAVKMASESVSEEMRVLYVAMTRAKDRLVMTYASQSLVSDLQDIALRRDFDGGRLLGQDATCMGDWVLLAAMGRREAGALHVLGGRPAETVFGDCQWKIETPKVGEIVQNSSVVSEDVPTLPAELEEQLRTALDFRYDHIPATHTPSKQTATGRKGRVKDAEAAENAEPSKTPERNWRQPSYLSEQSQGKSYGSAMHAALQYLKYENCGDGKAVASEIQRLVAEGFLTQEQGALVNPEKLARFFRTEPGKKLLSGAPCLREFKFSILDDGRHYGEGLEGEQVLLQGVVDCALLEPEGITVIDFKTDRVTEKTIHTAADRYSLQVQTYADALSRIYEMPVKRKLLYFFNLDTFIEL